MKRIVVMLMATVVASAGGIGAQSAPASITPNDSAIERILAERIDKQEWGVGIVVGVIEPAGRRVVAHGTFSKADARPVDGNTIFEIGSVTKVFTALVLADMVQRGEVALSDPVAKYLPAGTKVPERNGKQITLKDLAMQVSGLPRDASNLPRVQDVTNPFADYTVAQLYAFLASHRLRRDPGEKYEYSNVGVGLLGHALARRAGMTYEALIRQRLTGPLGMTSTGIDLPADLKARQARGHSAAFEIMPDLEINTLAGAGAIRSTVSDMLTFVGAFLGYTPSPLSAAMKSMVAELRPAEPATLRIGLGWHVLKIVSRDVFWHNGGTPGFRAFIAYEPVSRTGVVVLSNMNTDVGVDDIGVHLLYPLAPLASPPKKHVEIAIDPKLLDGYVGRFQLAPTFVIAVTRDGSRVFVQATDQPKFEVFPEGSRDFFSKAINFQITFEVDAAGRATALVLHQNGVDQRAPRVER